MSSADLLLSSTGNNWSHEVPPGTDPAAVIDGVDHFLNGQNINHDFWPSGTVTEDSTGSTHHVVNPPHIPDTGAAGTLLLMPVGLFWLARWRRTLVRV